MLSRNLITVSNLACHRGARLLIDNFNELVQQGGIVWLTGPNGVGKSTLLQVLAGVRQPLRGTVARAAEFIYQPSTPGFDPQLTVVQNLAWWAGIQALPQAMPIVAALAAWDLTAQAKAVYANLSQGQQQRAALARLSLVTAPLWILDEPLAHLDAAGQALFTAAAVKHLERGGAIIAATHTIVPLPEARVIDLTAAA